MSNDGAANTGLSASRADNAQRSIVNILLLAKVKWVHDLSHHEVFVRDIAFCRLDKLPYNLRRWPPGAVAQAFEPGTGDSKHTLGIHAPSFKEHLDSLKLFFLAQFYAHSF